MWNHPVVTQCYGLPTLLLSPHTCSYSSYLSATVSWQPSPHWFAHFKWHDAGGQKRKCQVCVDVDDKGHSLQRLKYDKKMEKHRRQISKRQEFKTYWKQAVSLLLLTAAAVSRKLTLQSLSAAELTFLHLWKQLAGCRRCEGGGTCCDRLQQPGWRDILCLQQRPYNGEKKAPTLTLSAPFTKNQGHVALNWCNGGVIIYDYIYYLRSRYWTF